MDQQIVDGIRLWLNARQLEAVHIDDKVTFEVLDILQNDLKQATAKEEYPWDTIVRGFNDRFNHRFNHRSKRE